MAQRTLVATVLAAAAAMQPSLALACSCIWPDDSAYPYGIADAVFAGTAVSHEGPFGEYGGATRVLVDTVWKGEVSEVILVVYGEHDPEKDQITISSCEEQLRVGQRWLVFATRRGDYLEAPSCLGTQAWRIDEGDRQAPSLFADLVARYGNGNAPSNPMPTEGPPTSEETHDSQAYIAPTAHASAAAPSSDASGEARSGSAGLTVAAVLGILLGVAFLAMRRIGRLDRTSTP